MGCAQQHALCSDTRKFQSSIACRAGSIDTDNIFKDHNQSVAASLIANYDIDSIAQMESYAMPSWQEARNRQKLAEQE